MWGGSSVCVQQKVCLASHKQPCSLLLAFFFKLSEQHVSDKSFNWNGSKRADHLTFNFATFGDWATTSILLQLYSGYGKYSDPLKFFTLCYIAAIC